MFGWTTRSSQLYENRLLRLGSPLFHFGILFVILGHVGGILIPESATKAVGISESMYHAAAVTLGTVLNPVLLPVIVALALVVAIAGSTPSIRTTLKMNPSEILRADV